jgi:hypothetical protein
LAAVPRTDDADTLNPPDRHIPLIAEKGRMAWQRAADYGRRNLVEIAIGRYKPPIGSNLCARTLPTQQGEAAITSS